MTVSSTEPYVTYTLTGIVTYSFTFRVLSETDLVVVHIDPDEVTTTLVLNTDYTVTLNPDGTGSIDLADITLLGDLMLSRSLPVTQEVAWVNNDPMDMNVQEESFDKITMILQDNFAKSIQYPPGFPADVVFPMPEADSIIGWDSEGVSLTNYAGYGSLTAALDTVNALVESAVAAEAQALIWAQEAANCFAATEDIYIKDFPVLNQTAQGMTSGRIVDVNTVGVGAAMYIAADGNYENAEASSMATMPCVAIALNSATGGVEAPFLKQGYYRDDSWAWTPGGIIYVSTTTGLFTQTPPSGSGEIVQNVGIAESPTVIYFNPSFDVAEVA